ncbi:acyl-CoA thioesterase, partial [Listeria monocytogenes]|nr:acyl-CoA thioesterase [Listeria monocytogenes]
KQNHAGSWYSPKARKIRLKENQSFAESLSTDIPW